MTTKFATWLRVTPSPTTLAESSAIYRTLSKQGRLSVFIKSKPPDTADPRDDDASTSTFYAVFPHEPTILTRSFTVPVYHNLPSARAQDHFNIRGLQDRKPMPAPKTFTCTLEIADRSDAIEKEEQMKKDSPFYKSFKARQDDIMENILLETNGPPGIPRNCARRAENTEDVPVRSENAEAEPQRYENPRRINMSSILEMCREAEILKATGQRG